MNKWFLLRRWRRRLCCG